MSSSAGRRSAAYVAFRDHLKTTRPPCCLNTGPWCTGIGDTVEHDPPLSTAPTPDQWVGVWRGACQPCQSRQGIAIRQRINTTRWTW